MKITHVIYSIDEANGGPSRSVTHLLATLGKNYPQLLLNLATGLTEKPIIHHFQQENCTLNFYTPKFLGLLRNLTKDLIHSHTHLLHGQAIWDLPVHQMAVAARNMNIPYIITPRGMLEPWSLTQSAFKKRAALALYQYKDLQNATCLHATAAMEAENFRKLGFTNPIAVIPNGVQISDFPIKEFKIAKEKQRKILFLSRIHKKKGIELLIEAWRQIPLESRNGWSIDIIGNGDPAYIATLEKEILARGLSNDIFIKGPIYGEKKCVAYQKADLFVLPSYSENFGIVVAEALASGTPVITTKGTPWKDLEENECGWYIRIGLTPLVTTLKKAMALPDSELGKMGRNGRKLIESKYSMEAVATQMHALYEWILTKKERPSFVKLD